MRLIDSRCCLIMISRVKQIINRTQGKHNAPQVHLLRFTDAVDCVDFKFFSFSSKVCKDEHYHDNLSDRDVNKRISIFNWRLLYKLYKLKPGLFFRSRTGRASSITQENDGLQKSPESINTPNQGESPYVPLLPYLFTSSHLLTNDENEAPKVKRNIGRWRNTNWIYSIRPERRRFSSPYRKKQLQYQPLKN